MKKDREEKGKKKRVKVGNNQRPKEWGKRGCGRDGEEILRGQSKDYQIKEGVFRAQ